MSGKFILTLFLFFITPFFFFLYTFEDKKREEFNMGRAGKAAGRAECMSCRSSTQSALSCSPVWSVVSFLWMYVDVLAVGLV